MDLNHLRESLLSARRPSLTPSVPESLQLESNLSRRRRSRINDENLHVSTEWSSTVSSLLRTRSSHGRSLPEGYHHRARKPRMEPEQSPDVEKITVTTNGGSPDSPEGVKGFRSSWQIDVKDLVGDAVGNMSISPTSRDIVLAARRGLYIIDLQSPLNIPRFLPQGGTWDVADVQWNPHPSHAQYIVSTSSEKLLIWNLRMGGKTSIEHILRSHYRAITDINWHTSECDIVVSTGIDSWIWAWDLRQTQKPIFGLSAFKAGGTQVKWNYLDGNLLASSHSNEVLIWDRRKGSLPLTKIQAHGSKIYGIDWSRHNRNEIVTCSLDTTIKSWDINDLNTEGPTKPISCIQTNYPVWRARNTPFGEGILSLPQRGETTLELYAKSDTPQLVETFEGHSDVVKEFVWRKNGQSDFQLITWSKDRTLRFWPIDAEVMQKVGHVPELVRGRSRLTRNEFDVIDTFANEPEGQEEFLPFVSAPVGGRAILAEVRAPQPPRHAPQAIPHTVASLPEGQLQNDATPTLTSTKPILMAAKSTGGDTMSKAGVGAKSVAPVDQLAWMASVRVGSKRGSSSGGGSHSGSGAPSRLGSQSRVSSRQDLESMGERQRSSSLNRGNEERKEGEANQSVHDEITSVLTKLSAKIKLEKYDESGKKRSCTLGLHGPWGETSSVFMRATFIFPRDYPYGIHPQGTPTVDLEKNPLISMPDRAFILKRLRRIRERKRPCLEACLRFLLYADEGHNSEESDSSDDDKPSGQKTREITVSLLRNNKNLAEPRTSQGSFGPNGELIVFFRAPPRIMRHIIRGVGDTGNGATEDSSQSQSQSSQTQTPEIPPQPPQFHSQKSYFQSPALVSDAVRRLGLAAMDRFVEPIDPRHPEAGSNILRAMTNLLTMPYQKARRETESKNSDDVAKNFSLLPTRRSTVFLTTTTTIAGADKKVAVDYIFSAPSLAELCEINAAAAKKHGRFDHERIFRTLKALFIDPASQKSGDESGENAKESAHSFCSGLMASKIVTRLYSDMEKQKDIQMLAMIAVVVLQTSHGTITIPVLSRKKESSISPIPNIPTRTGGMDYFSIAKSINPPSPGGPAWGRVPSPMPPTLTPSLSSSNSSRGSWSSLFNTGSMRQFMNGVQDSFRDGLTTPGGTPQIPAPEIQLFPSKSAEKPFTGSSMPKRRPIRKESSFQSTGSGSLSRSWNEGAGHIIPGRALTSSFSSIGSRRVPLRFADSTPFNEKQIVFEPPSYEESARPLFPPELLEQFRMNVYFYAELLFRWQFFRQRLELLKAVNQRQESPQRKTEIHRIGLLRLCPRLDCKAPLPTKANICPHCHSPASMPACTICRLPVKGLSWTCLTCAHVSHIPCWNSWDGSALLCPSGCGCFCSGSDGPFTRPSTRLGLTPPASMLLLPTDIT